MQKKVKIALISVFYKDGLEEIISLLHKEGVQIMSTGGTRTFIEEKGIPCTPVESLTNYPSILGGRVKTLHPVLFGGILGKREDEVHAREMSQFGIPEIDLVIVDLYPFEETVKSTSDESLIIEKIDIGGPSMIRAAAKNHRDVIVIASKNEYKALTDVLKSGNMETSVDQRRDWAIKAFDVCTAYDVAISNYFHGTSIPTAFNTNETVLRYGENPHQQGRFYGNLDEMFTQLHGKALSYNNLADVDAAVQLINEFGEDQPATFAIIKHTNVCGIAQRNRLEDAWRAALQGDPESAFGGVLVSNKSIDEATASAINDLFFEVLIAPSIDEEALNILQSKKNRILLLLKSADMPKTQVRSVLNGLLVQDVDAGNYSEWKEATSVSSSKEQRNDLTFANIVCKHLKSNSIALVKNMQLIGKGCGQTSRVDALRHSIEKAKHSGLSTEGAVLASDAFFPFDDCVKIAHAAGISAFIQPGGSVRDADSINYCESHSLPMVITGRRHFKH
ncbi:MAG: bifunctional phosphoribosylaminoimidazolecarboxamide formyltransferase/IMP cyclohydrolase [Chitinophagaceae bacterium]|nr:MAG: bifunctional phosphoribosylaminoimidazolecarboxamide formyltransferase/IMP cyclohydrolase [Chitinophagaceae bacterium]